MLQKLQLVLIWKFLQQSTNCINVHLLIYQAPGQPALHVLARTWRINWWHANGIKLLGRSRWVEASRSLLFYAYIKSTQRKKFLSNIIPIQVSNTCFFDTVKLFYYISHIGYYIYLYIEKNIYVHIHMYVWLHIYDIQSIILMSFHICIAFIYPTPRMC